MTVGMLESVMVKQSLWEIWGHLKGNKEKERSAILSVSHKSHVEQ